MPAASTRTRVLLLFIFLVPFAAYFPIANAQLDNPVQRMEGLVKPGDVIKGHARFEKKCEKCHEPFDKTKQKELCRDCHEEINNDIKKKSGFHGHIHDIANRECHSCHTEHKGRDMDIVQMDEELFDHNRTNFKLRGNHVSIPCKSCHKKARYYRLPKHECNDCHERNDSHKGRMGRNCNNCHIESAWMPSYFNHAKTDFPLRNNHETVQCQNCHVNERYKDTPKNCYFCHFLQDVHNGDRGIKCHECHTDERWSRIEFDHDEDTDYKIKDAHKRLLCKDCHKGNVFKDETPNFCFGCHEIHDVHNGLYGKKCGDCHTEKEWKKIRFNHDTDTNFKLKGEHKELQCNACHKGQLFKEKTSTKCSACHLFDDTHEGQEGDNCAQCHNEKSWVKKVVFDHDLTKFPLLGSHPLLTCEDCHASGKYKDEDYKCDACHKKDDVHKRKLTKKCELCHGPLDWLVWKFDHDQTDYPLDGAHDGLDCLACHSKPVEDKIELPTNCFGCHEKDDNHNGQLGRQCEKCHITKTFKEIVIK